MRLHGRYKIDPARPRARGVCDFCGFFYQLSDLNWYYQWSGPSLRNFRFLVCKECLDIPSEQLRTIILPPDPIPVMNARPENNVSDDNPMSAIGVGANFFTPQYGSRIGNLTGAAGINAAFDGNINKQSWQSACNTISNSSYNNYVGINWEGNVSQLNMPSSMKPPVIKQSLTSFTAYAPNDRGFLGSVATSYVVQTSPVNTSLWGAWTTISSGTTTGTAGETISATCTGGQYQFHRLAFLGDQLNYVSVAQVKFNVAQIATPSTAGSS